MYIETAHRADMMEQLEHTAEFVADEVIDLALPLTELADRGYDADRQKFYEVMGIRKAAFLTVTSGEHTVLITDDTVQESGAFKSRGAAYAAMMSVGDVLTAASAGNHGNGVAIAGKRLGKKTIVEAASNASIVKVSNMEDNGATVNAVHASVDAAMPAAKQKAAELGGAFIHPYDDLRVIAGQATLGFDQLEKLLTDEAEGKLDLMRDTIKVFVPIGGGGLISGVASVFRWAKDHGIVGEQVAVIGVQMEGCDAMRRTVMQNRAGLTSELFLDGEFNPSCDGTAVKEPGTLAQQIVSDERFVADIVTVTEEELGHAMHELETAQSKRVEPAGALSMAGALVDMDQNDTPTKYVTISSGCNVSDETWQHFMEAAGYSKPVAAQQKSLGGYILREMAAHPHPESVRPSRESVDDYYDMLEEQGIFMIRRYN